jgi:hypothetical protein
MQPVFPPGVVGDAGDLGGRIVVFDDGVLM